MSKKFSTIFSRCATALLAAAVCVGCNVDDSYDLSNVDGEFGLGTDDTQFLLPLLSVSIDPSQQLDAVGPSYSVVNLTKGNPSANTNPGFLKDSNYDLFGNLSKINSVLPDREEGIDLFKATNDKVYLSELIDDLTDEIADDDLKCENFCAATANEEEFAEIKWAIYDDLNVDLNDEADRTDNLQAVLNNPAMSDEVAGVKLKIQQTIYGLIRANIHKTISAGSIDIDSSTIEMLNNNLDGDKNKISLLATFKTDLDLDIILELKVTYNGKQIDVPAVEASLKDTLKELQGGEIKDGEELDEILADLDFDVTFYVKNYDPSKPIVTEGKYINLTFVILKTGSLKI